MSIEKIHAITDVCILAENIERTVEFYTEKLGFALRRRAEGFADFHSPGVTLAAWEIDHIHKYAGVSNARTAANAHKACIAVRLEGKAQLLELYEELCERGVEFQSPPEFYPWNAHCAYFSDPDGTLWELYAWGEGGPGDYHEEFSE